MMSHKKENETHGTQQVTQQEIPPLAMGTSSHNVLGQSDQMHSMQSIQNVHHGQSIQSMQHGQNVQNGQNVQQGQNEEQMQGSQNGSMQSRSFQDIKMEQNYNVQPIKRPPENVDPSVLPVQKKKSSLD